MTISVPVQGYANSPEVQSDSNTKLIVIGVIVVAVIIAALIIIFKK